MNMYLHELKAYRKSTIIWTCVLAVVVIFFLSMFSAFSSSAADLKKLFGNFPEAVRKGFGINLEIITSILGYYSFVFSYVVLCGAIQAMHLGTAVISKEVRDKTADFLLTKPISRKRIMTAKLLAVFTSLLFTSAVYLAAAYVMALTVSPESFSTKVFLMVSATLFFVQLIFASIGVFVSVVARKIRSVLSVALGTVFGFFFISMFGSVIGEEAIKFVTPFKYFDPAYIIKNSAYDIKLLLVGAAIAAAAVAVSYFIYSSKDIHAV